MIEVAGEMWGTAKEIADHIGNGLTLNAVRRWETEAGLAAVRMKDENGRRQVVFLLSQAILIDKRVRGESRGRPRCLTAP